MQNFFFIVAFAVSTRNSVATSILQVDGLTSTEKAEKALKNVVSQLKRDSHVTILSQGVYEK